MFQGSVGSMVRKFVNEGELSYEEIKNSRNYLIPLKIMVHIHVIVMFLVTLLKEILRKHKHAILVLGICEGDCFMNVLTSSFYIS